MTTDAYQFQEQRAARGLWLAVVLFGGLINPLMLTGPLFMLQVYDRVLPSGSVPTLAVLFALVAFLYAVMALLDAARARLMLRIGARIQAGLEPRVMAARGRALGRDPVDPRAIRALEDLDAVQRALASPALLALFDTPWAFAFLALLFLFHPAMGALALVGGAFLIALGVWSRWRQRHWQARAVEAGQAADRLARGMAEDADAVATLGMGPAIERVWRARRDSARAAAVQAADRQAFDAAASRSFRLFMQSAILALGGWLVLNGVLSPGLIVAASILMGRALTPVEQVSSQWGQLRAARAAWHRIHAFLAAVPGSDGALPVRPGAELSLQGIVVAQPGGGTMLRLDRLSVAPGRALGVIGPTGAGKTLLAGVILGRVPVTTGRIRLGAMVLPAPAMTIGYLPQCPVLFDGTVAQNIARFDPAADLATVERAARLCDLHEHVLHLPAGYETMVDRHGSRLPRGVLQRIALARAVCAMPSLVILDEPNAHLDAQGMAALNAAIRALKAAGAIVIVLSHRPSGIAECDDLLVLDAGQPVAHGARDRVLREVVRNHTALVSSLGQGVAG